MVDRLGGDALPRRARRLGQRQVLAGQDRPARRARDRASDAGRLALADRRFPPGRPADPQPRRRPAPRRVGRIRAEPAGRGGGRRSCAPSSRAARARSSNGATRTICRRARTCSSWSTSSRSCSATATTPSARRRRRSSRCSSKARARRSRSAHLRRHHHALGISRARRADRRAGRGDQPRPLPHAAHEPRPGARGDRRAGRGLRLRDRAGAGQPAPQRPHLLRALGGGGHRPSARAARRAAPTSCR